LLASDFLQLQHIVVAYHVIFRVSDVPCSNVTINHSEICRSLREKGGSLRVADRPAEPGDTLIVDFDVKDASNQETILGLKYDKHEIDTIDEGNFLPNLILQMYGMKAGEEITLDFQFPDPWEPPELSGRKAKVRSILGLVDDV
jgi:FKBP-type peptidyl-prolyl cis-trans isomerase (trigger factor)